jgi:predicted nucleic acid-binding protein
MILVDTSVWIDHLRSGDERLASLLNAGSVLIHPFVIGELALGNLRHRDTVLTLLQGLAFATTAIDDEVLAFISRRGLAGRGIGYVDAHLLAATMLTAGVAFWTKDKRLAGIAADLGLAARFD